MKRGGLGGVIAMAFILFIVVIAVIFGTAMYGATDETARADNITDVANSTQYTGLTTLTQTGLFSFWIVGLLVGVFVVIIAAMMLRR